MYVSTAPQTLPVTNAAAAGIKAFYFHDIDNHNLEVIYFPKGKGNEKWQEPNGKIFLGIDYTAIGISNTESSLQFFQSIPGIERKGESFNWVTEQERLNNVKGASLLITWLCTAAGSGIEFLQCLKPCAGMPYPADTRADDIWYWQNNFIYNRCDSIVQQIKKAGYNFVFKEIVHLKNSKAFIVKDKLVMQC